LLPYLADHPMAAGDVFIIASNSGGNAVITEFATLARERGVRTIGITNLRHATSPSARNAGGPRLHQLVDVAIDNGGVVGDAAIAIEGLPGPVGPTSTVAGAAIVNAIVAETVERLIARGIVPEVFLSSNVAGGDAANDARKQQAAADQPARAASPFAIRGVIEGYYGRPWTRHSARAHRLPDRA
jgi:uncharacterized phosphosugar-binding protein